MKTKDNIECNMLDVEELERIASDSSIKVPDGLDAEISGMLDSLDAAERILAPERRNPVRPWGYITGAAACAVLLIGLGIAVSRPKVPQDTFSDPALAYAEVERALASISEKMNTGVERASSAEQSIEKHTAVLNLSSRRNESGREVF